MPFSPSCPIRGASTPLARALSVGKRMTGSQNSGTLPICRRTLRAVPFPEPSSMAISSATNRHCLSLAGQVEKSAWLSRLSLPCTATLAALPLPLPAWNW